MRIFVLAVLGAALLLPVVSSRANDGYIGGVAGSPMVSRGEHPQIRMESERVVLTVKSRGTFETDARFVFVNDSDKRVAVRMGFPEENGNNGSIQDNEAMAKSKTQFLRFTTWVNGAKVRAQRTALGDPRHDQIEIRWIKTVSFAPRERKNVRVLALSDVGLVSSGKGGFYGRSEYLPVLSYNFTGANWKGLVARSDLEVRFPFDGLWAASASAYDESARKFDYWKPKVEVKNGVGVLRHTWRNWQAQSAVHLHYQRVMPNWMDETAIGNGDDEARRWLNTVTFGVGKNRKIDLGAPNGFVRDGVSFVAWNHLAYRLRYLDLKVPVASTWDAKTGAATLQRAGVAVSFVPGSKVMTVKKGDAPAQTVELRAAPVLLRVGGGQTLYVPLAASARALGLGVKVEPEKRRFSIG